ncbi:F-box/LRR-repeat protein At3g26922-like [Bidens hawaiensis]|uniref:F-box/LRR-repeat protein At3g26922-like n=1 Tax=Bidens hawaiensis TaxID=980011 RepID=UPI004049A1F0
MIEEFNRLSIVPILSDVSEGTDRLSVLPDDLILKIFSFVSSKDAVKTSVLSPRWRYAWTSVRHLSFSSDDFSTMAKFSNFVTLVLCRRSKQAQLSSVNLYLRRNDVQDVPQRIMNYAFFLNVQHVNFTCLSNKYILFPLSLSLASTWELSSLTTLHLDRIILYDGFFSKFPNLESLTLIHCNMMKSKVLRICHPRLSNLSLDNGDYLSKTTNVVTPQLKSLNITNISNSYLISAPELVSFLFQDSCPFTFSRRSSPFKFLTDGFHSLENAQLSLRYLDNSDAPNIISLLEKLHNVKVLSLSMEIIKLLNASVELISHQPSPFAQLKSFKILPKVVCVWNHEHARFIMSMEVQNYFLNSFPKATLTVYAI